MSGEPDLLRLRSELAQRGTPLVAIVNGRTTDFNPTMMMMRQCAARSRKKFSDVADPRVAISLLPRGKITRCGTIVWPQMVSVASAFSGACPVFARRRCMIEPRGKLLSALGPHRTSRTRDHRRASGCESLARFVRESQFDRFVEICPADRLMGRENHFQH
jgi:hypothetical protein